MQNSIPIVPISKPLSGEVILPGSKSITNRAMILAALCSKQVTLINALISEDTVLMADALETLGFFVSVNRIESIISIEGNAGNIPRNHAVLNVGNAGTVARFLLPFLCLQTEGKYYLNGSEAMRKRPMKELLLALEKMRAAKFVFHQERWHFPFSMDTFGFPGGTIEVDAKESSQILSAILMIAPLAFTPTKVKLLKSTVSYPFIQMTLKMMEEFGQEENFLMQDNCFIFNSNAGYRYFSDFYQIEPDASALSYFLSLTLICGGKLKVPGLSNGLMKQGDIAFADILEPLGLKIFKTSNEWKIQKEKGSLMKGVDANFNDFSDTFLTLAAIAPLLNGVTKISGIKHTRKQETDRVAAVTKELRKLGQEVDEMEDSIAIHPRPLKPAEIETYNDHRMAMSFAVLGSYDLNGNGTSWIKIKNPDCCLKTFPKFFKVLDSLK